MSTPLTLYGKVIEAEEGKSPEGEPILRVKILMLTPNDSKLFIRGIASAEEIPFLLNAKQSGKGVGICGQVEHFDIDQWFAENTTVNISETLNIIGHKDNFYPCILSFNPERVERSLGTQA